MTTLETLFKRVAEEGGLAPPPNGVFPTSLKPEQEQAVSAINETLNSICQANLFPFQLREETFNIIANQRDYPFISFAQPFFSFDRMAANAIVLPSGKILTYTDYQNLDGTGMNGVTQGEPTYYTILNNSLRLYPTPSESMATKLRYYGSNLGTNAGGTEIAVLSLGTDNSVLPSKFDSAVVYGAASRVYFRMGNDAKYKGLSEQYDRELSRCLERVSPAGKDTYQTMLPYYLADNQRNPFYPFGTPYA